MSPRNECGEISRAAGCATVVLWLNYYVCRDLPAMAATFYCLLPVAVFALAWGITRAPGYSLCAALGFALAPALHGGGLTWAGLGASRRLWAQVAGNETAHCAGLTLALLAMLFAARALERRRVVDIGLAVALGVGAVWASSLVVVPVVVAGVALWVVVRPLPDGRGSVTIGAFTTRALPSRDRQGAVVAALSGPRSLTALAVAWLGGTVLWHYLPRLTKDWRLQFFCLFAYGMAAIPVFRFLPQPEAYRLELEVALALLVVFAARPLHLRLPRAARGVALVLLLAAAGVQVVNHRRFAKAVTAGARISPAPEKRTPPPPG